MLSFKRIFSLVSASSILSKEMFVKAICQKDTHVPVIVLDVGEALFNNYCQIEICQAVEKKRITLEV